MRIHTRAIRYLRKMRGGAQSHLLQAGDNDYYVVKFRNNPQHRRVLVNEWIAGSLMQRLGFWAPRTAVIEITRDFLAKNPEVNIQTGQKTTAVQPGLHFGSRYPGDPAEVAVYDALPSSLLPSVSNYGEFIGALVFDKWVGNTDKRQAVFYRAQSVHGFSGQRMIAQFIDNGLAFGGSDWDLKAVGPLAGLYWDKTVYTDVRSSDSFEPWVSLIQGIREQELWDIVSDVPKDWVADDQNSLVRLIDALLRRRARLADLVYDVREAQPALFPNWVHVEASARHCHSTGKRRHPMGDGAAISAIRFP